MTVHRCPSHTCQPRPINLTYEQADAEYVAREIRKWGVPGESIVAVWERVSQIANAEVSRRTQANQVGEAMRPTPIDVPNLKTWPGYTDAFRKIFPDSGEYEELPSAARDAELRERQALGIVEFEPEHPPTCTTLGDALMLLATLRRIADSLNVHEAVNHIDMATFAVERELAARRESKS